MIENPYDVPCTADFPTYVNTDGLTPGGSAKVTDDTRGFTREELEGLIRFDEEGSNPSSVCYMPLPRGTECSLWVYSTPVDEEA
mgnify:CR=1 FL=1